MLAHCVSEVCACRREESHIRARRTFPFQGFWPDGMPSIFRSNKPCCSDRSRLIVFIALHLSKFEERLIQRDSFIRDGVRNIHRQVDQIV